jgi:Transposase DDE domain
MTIEDYLLELFYLIDSELAALNRPRLRARGPAPRLDDSEVLTIELAGELLGLDTDLKIYQHFRHYHRREFPALARVHRSTFVRQSANLWQIKQVLLSRLLRLLPLEDPVTGQTLWLIDSFPLRVCRLKRAARHKLFAGLAAYGRDPTAGHDRFFGFRVHLRVSDRGFCAAFTLAPGNCADLALVQEVAPQSPATLLGDACYWGAQAHRHLREKGLLLLAPYQHKSADPRPLLARLITRLRQPIEPVIGQLAQRFHSQKTWARDLWHLCSRVARKVLSHSAAALINWRAGNPPLELAQLISD